LLFGTKFCDNIEGLEITTWMFSVRS